MPGRASVVHMAAYGGPYRGSFIPMLEAARGAVESRGWTFETVFTDGAQHRPWHARLREEGFPVHVAPAMGLRAATSWVRQFLARRPSPAVVHTHFSGWDMPAALAGRRRGHSAVIWHLHSRLHDEPAVLLRNVVRFGAVGRFADRILCVGPEIRDKALARFAPSSRTELFPNGIDVEWFSPCGADARDAARRRLQLPPDGSVLLLFGWDWETKGGPLLLDTLSLLRRRGRNVRAVVVGSEPTIDSAISNHVAHDLVRVIAPVDDVRPLYAAADILVVASLAEGFCFSLVEAISCGTPAVVSDVPGLRYVSRGLDACRLAPREASAFADAVAAELDADPGERDIRLAASRNQVERNYSLALWSDRLIELYERVLGERNGG